MTVPYTIHTGVPGEELIFAQIFHRPDETVSKPPIGVYLFEVEDHEFQVSISESGLHAGDAVWPDGLERRMSEVVTLNQAKLLMRDWLKEVEAAIQPEWNQPATLAHKILKGEQP